MADVLTHLADNARHDEDEAPLVEAQVIRAIAGSEVSTRRDGHVAGEGGGRTHRNTVGRTLTGAQ